MNDFEISELLQPEEIYEAISEGVNRAVWRMITRATDMPGHDFYDTIKAATESAFSKLDQSVMPNFMWSNDLQCDWISWRVIDTGHLALDLPDGDCCDMSGAIKIAQAICPSVQRIDTFSGGTPDTRYMLDTITSDWTALAVSA